MKLETFSTQLFTFHYVSIKSAEQGDKITYELKFTFHYVSIKSAKGIKQFENINRFTFHYVSIKSISSSDMF